MSFQFVFRGAIVTTFVSLLACSEPQPANPAAEATQPQAPTAQAHSHSAAQSSRKVQDIDYSPYVDNDFPQQVLFGDTHLHTAYSADAGLVGAVLNPDDAYRYAKGETVVSNSGLKARLPRPLDFLVIADHAENLGLPAAIAEKNPELLANEWGAELAKLVEPGDVESMIAGYTMWLKQIIANEDPLAGSPLPITMWKRSTEAAERHNQPGLFTAMIGFEWTSQPDGNNLHRNILFRDGKDFADQVLPISSYDTDDPEKLWDWMEAYEEKTGGSLLAIPHNGNLSNGLMFDDVTLGSKQPISAEYAARRARFEPVYEVTQPKGDGEAHPALSPDDDLADYYTWDKGSFGPEIKTPDMLPREYAREALKRGMAYEQKLGTNPFKFGLIGSTDAHTGLTAPTEDNWFGKVAAVEPSANEMRFYEAITGRLATNDEDKIFHWQTGAAGMAAVWATENTREAIFDAFKRKEVYATTGSRMQVRVFGGFDFTADDINRSDFVKHGYAQGVPMGGDLSAAPKDKTPSFVVAATRDPDGANLDRVQMVKGWLNADGTSSEKVYNIAWSDERVADADGNIPAVGNTVDEATASYTNAIGDPVLSAYWQDPDFDPTQSAFYYVRVIEIPTPRWTTYDAKVFGVDIPEGADIATTERAYTSPIWYTP